MTISDVITKYYSEFSGMVRNPDVVIENSNTSEDIFENAILTALKKFKGMDITEEEGYEYTRKTILTEAFFSKKRKCRDILVFTDENLDGLKSR